jgi:hypothetical protein
MQQELILIKKQMRWLKFYAVVSSAIFVVFLLAAFNKQDEKFGVIRAKGIVIEDGEGRDRILIGSPVPFSKSRVRTDTNLVRKYWAKQYGKDSNQFMKWYKDYYNSAEGIVVMNENGFDRVLLGDKLADPNTGKRMFEPAGILWNDKEGWELGGAGVNTTEDGKARAVIGVDDKDGEAVHIIALEDGTKGLVIGGENGRLLIGMSKKNGQWFQNKNAFTGIKYFNNKGELVWEQDMSKK